MPFQYPTAFEQRLILPELVARGREGRLMLDIFPIRTVNAPQVRWIQRDNYHGLQHMRGLDGAPTRVQRVGAKAYVYEPGVFGDFIDITETELTTRAGVFPIDTTPIPVGDLIQEAQELLIGREFDRMESSIASILTTGTISIKLDGPDGTQTAYNDTYPIQTYTAGVPWSTVATATPIRNFQSVQQLGVGYSVDLGAGATAYMNSVTSNNLLNNTNAADFGGRRNAMGATVNNLNDVNQYLLGQNLPKIQVYDGGYYPTPGGSFTKFIPDGKVVVIGKRPGNAPVGEYQLTRNLNNPNGAPGSYTYVKDYANGINAPKQTPPKMEVHRGHNGGPAILYPSAVVLMNV